MPTQTKAAHTGENRIITSSPCLCRCARAGNHLGRRQQLVELEEAAERKQTTRLKTSRRLVVIRIAQPKNMSNFSRLSRRPDVYGCPGGPTLPRTQSKAPRTTG